MTQQSFIEGIQTLTEGIGLPANDGLQVLPLLAAITWIFVALPMELWPADVCLMILKTNL